MPGPPWAESTHSTQRDSSKRKQARNSTTVAKPNARSFLALIFQNISTRFEVWLRSITAARKERRARVETTMTPTKQSDPEAVDGGKKKPPPSAEEKSSDDNTTDAAATDAAAVEDHPEATVPNDKKRPAADASEPSAAQNNNEHHSNEQAEDEGVDDDEAAAVEPSGKKKRMCRFPGCNRVIKR